MINGEAHAREARATNSTLATLSCGLAAVVLLVDAWRKWGVEVLQWVVVYGISDQGVGGGVAGGRGGGLGEFRECQLRAELGCGGVSRWTLCVDNTV